MGRYNRPLHPSLRLLLNPKLNKHIMFEEDLLQMHAGSLNTSSISVSPYDPYLQDFLHCILLMSSTHLSPTGILPLFCLVP